MKTVQYEVTSPMGIHARPAAILAQCCVNLPSQITIKHKGRVANGNNVIQILSLNAQKGSVLEISAEGGDEEASLNEVMKIIAERCCGKKTTDALRIAFFRHKGLRQAVFQ